MRDLPQPETISKGMHWGFPLRKGRTASYTNATAPLSKNRILYSFNCIRFMFSLPLGELRSLQERQVKALKRGKILQRHKLCTHRTSKLFNLAWAKSSTKVGYNILLLGTIQWLWRKLRSLRSRISVFN
jgi:hypothetical protein